MFLFHSFILPLLINITHLLYQGKQFLYCANVLSKDSNIFNNIGHAIVANVTFEQSKMIPDGIQC